MLDGRGPELVAIIAAMAEEIAPLRARMGVIEEIRDGPRRYLKGTLKGVPIVLAVSGEGKRNADLVMRRVIQKCVPTRVLGIGLAGALSHDLVVGDLLVASEVLEGHRVLAWPDLQWFEEAGLGKLCELGRVVTVDEVLADPDAKQRWWRETMRDQPAVADMESAGYARVAIAYKLPYLMVRAVSDTASEQLPPFLEDCRDQDGSISRREVAWKAFWRPGSWAALWRLQRRIGRLSLRLADIAERLVGALGQAGGDFTPSTG